MAVLIEGISVVIRKDAVEEKFPSGLARFVDVAVPNATFCQDRHLLRVGFMSPADAREYVEQLGMHGLIFIENGQPVDVAVADQLHGVRVACAWIRFFKAALAPGQTVAACALVGDDDPKIAAPQAWAFEGSLSHRHTFIPAAEVEGRLKAKESENGLASYLDQKTGKTVYLGSPFTAARKQEREALAQIVQRALRLDGLADDARRRGDRNAGGKICAELQTMAQQARDWCGRSKLNVGFAYFTLGLVLRILQERESAIEAFSKSLEFNPDDVNTLLEITRCLGELGRPLEAEPLARRAAELAPQSAATVGNLAVVLANLGRKEDARQMIRKALALAPDDPINRQVAAALGIV
jgi:hypothetical protein